MNLNFFKMKAIFPKWLFVAYGVSALGAILFSISATPSSDLESYQSQSYTKEIDSEKIAALESIKNAYQRESRLEVDTAKLDSSRLNSLLRAEEAKRIKIAELDSQINFLRGDSIRFAHTSYSGSVESFGGLGFVSVLMIFCLVAIGVSVVILLSCLPVFLITTNAKKAERVGGMMKTVFMVFSGNLAVIIAALVKGL